MVGNELGAGLIVVAQEEVNRKEQQTRSWGEVLDPDGDCKFTFGTNKLVISIPDSVHGMSVERGRVNAPRVWDDVSGDFVAEVKVSGEFPQNAQSLVATRKPFHGAGLIAWQSDDTYVRLQFKPAERETLRDVKSTLFPPRTLRQLIAVRGRVHRGTFELARLFPELSLNRGRSNNRTLISLFKEPRLWPALLIYCWVNVAARYKAIENSKMGARSWQRDETSRARLSAKPQE